MPFEPFTFDDSVTRTEPARARVPEGYYLLECDGAEPTAADYEKTPGVYFSWRIVQGPASSPNVGVGGRLRDYNTLKSNAQFGIGMTLGALGLGAIATSLAGRSIPTYQHLQTLVAQIATRAKGKRAVGLIADQAGTSRPFSGIESLFPADQWDNLRGSMVARNGPVPTGTPGAAAGGGEDIFADLDRRI